MVKILVMWYRGKTLDWNTGVLVLMFCFWLFIGIQTKNLFRKQMELIV